VILGAPNAGKSTLFNYFCGSERAIVSPHPGTTRDLVECELDMDGVPILLQDTAGLRRGGDEIEAEGHRRALAAAAGADLAVVMWALDDDAADGPPDLPDGLPTIRVRSKADVRPAAEAGEGWLAISCHSGAGLEALREELMRRVLADVPDLGGAVAIAGRHRHALEAAAAELDHCDLERPEAAAEGVRWAVRAIDDLVGTVAADDVLDEIYSTFCIGK